MPDPLVTEDELRSYLDVVDAQFPDERVRPILDGVEDLVLGYCRRRRSGFDEVTDETIQVNGRSAYELLLPEPPIIDLTELLEDDVALVDGTDFEWTEDGILRRLNGRWTRRARWYTVTYSHGFETVPEVVKLVVKRVASRAAVNPEGLAQEIEGGAQAAYGYDATRLASLSDRDTADLDEFRLDR